MNFSGGDAGGAGTEDCLKINVYAPAGAKRGDNCQYVQLSGEYVDHKFCSFSACSVLYSWWRFVEAVLLLFGSALLSNRHPGYAYGNPSNWPFDAWVHQSPNVVITSVYYRLDSFGFLATPEFEDSSLGDFNVGFTDQVMALKWVKQNIGAFGGDASKITINGQSAGGSSVELHLVADHENIFSGAIAQSVFRTPVPTPAQVKVYTLRHARFWTF